MDIITTKEHASPRYAALEFETTKLNKDKIIIGNNKYERILKY